AEIVSRPWRPYPGSLSRLESSRNAGPRVGETFVDHRQQGRRRKRLAQAARRAELEGHSQEVRRRRVEVRKGVSRHRDQWNRWRALVKYPDRFEASHVG